MLGRVTESGEAMPEPRRLELPLLQTGQGERFYLERFMAEFGETHDGTALIDAPTGHRLAVSSRLFLDHTTGRTKIDKNGRAPYVLYVAETVKRPDEIRLTAGHFGDQALYCLARYLIGTDTTNILVIFKARGKVWEGWSGYQIPSRRAVYWETKREGTLLYRRLET